MTSKKIYPIIGMSPWNSYFKDDEIAYLLKTTIDRYGYVAIMIADTPAISTYMAMGYPENRARKDKAIPKWNALKNKIKRAMTQLWYLESQVRIIDWENEIETNNSYKESYRSIVHFYEWNEKFRNDVIQTTKWVLDKSWREFSDIDVAAKMASHYLLSEFAFLNFAEKFLNTQKIVYIYHKNWTVYENYISWKYDGIPKENIDFLLMENPSETFRLVWPTVPHETQCEYMSSLDRVEKTKILRVAFTNYPPVFIYDDEYDNFSGIFYEIIIHVARKYGWQVKWTEETWYGVIVDGLNDDRFDIFGSTVWPTPERLKKALFSKSLYLSNAYPWIRSDFDYASKKDDRNTRLVVKENDISHSIALADFPDARLVFIPQLSDTIELLEFVATGKWDITFVEPYLAKFFMEERGVNLIKATDHPIRVFENTFIFKKYDPSLRDLFDYEIKQMLENGKIKELLRKYMGHEEIST